MMKFKHIFTTVLLAIFLTCNNGYCDIIKEILTIGSPPTGNFYAVTTDSKGNIYATNHFNLIKYNKNGDYIKEYNIFNNFQTLAWGLCTDKNDNIYIASIGSIIKFDTILSVLFKFGSYGPNLGQFSAIDVAVDLLGNIYVADNYSSRIQKFNSNGTFILSFGKYGTGDTQFLTIKSLSIDSKNNIYVQEGTDTVSSIKIFSSNGNFIKKINTQITTDGSKIEPLIANGAAVAPNGMIVAVGGSYLHKFSSNYLPIETVAPAGLTGYDYLSGSAGYPFIDTNGKLYIADFAGKCIRVYTWGLSTSTPTPTPNSNHNILVPLYNLLLED